MSPDASRDAGAVDASQPDAPAPAPTPTPETLEGWGMAHRAGALVYRPRTPHEAEAALADARARRRTTAFRGAGLSYGDAALVDRGAVIALDGLEGEVRIDPVAGTATAPASATIRDLWTAALPHGWWVPVVPGTMKVTLGGAIAANVHGKNHVSRGTFGDHVAALDLLDPDAGLRSTADPEEIARWTGSLGLRGAILGATVRLKRVHGGHLDVTAVSTGSLDETLDRMREGAARHEYAVAWVDAFGGNRAGRGILHFADPIPADHPEAGRAMSEEAQRLPPRLFGVVPRGWVPPALRLFAHDPGMRLLNLGRRSAGRLRDGARYLQTHAAFHFLLDYVPGWKRIYRPGGLLQVQFFLPADRAAEGFREVFRAQADTGVHAWLGVVKCHPAPARPHDYWRDGFSLALDIPVRRRRDDARARLLTEFDRIREAFGGGLYAAKDGVSRGVLPPDPHPALGTDLSRRWAGDGR